MKNIYIFFLISATLFTQKISAQQPGDLDSTFNSVGFNTLDMQSGEDNEAYGIAIQSNGRIVIAGYVYDSDGFYNAAIARYLQNGTLDNSFNTTGYFNLFLDDNSETDAVAIQSDGKIVAAGHALNSSLDVDFLVIRLKSDGSLDSTFGTNGITITDFDGYNDYGYEIAIQSNGKILVSGSSYDGDYDEFAIARYNADGSLDSSFSADGWLMEIVGSGNSEVFGLAVEPGGKIYAGGYCENGTDSDFGLIRLNNDGTMDNTFNSTGEVVTDIDGYNECLNALVLQTDGKIVTGGFANNDSDDDFALVRYNTDGTLDDTFDGDGIQTTDLFFSSDEDVFSVKLQQDGKIIASGTAYDNTQYYFALARYNTDGSLDTDFSGDGLVTTDINGSDDEIYASEIQTDGKIVVAGATDNGNYDFAIARYLTDDNVGILDFNSPLNSYLIYPNPVSNLAHLEYELMNAATVSAQLLDVQGKLVAQIFDSENQTAGKHDLNINFNEKMAAGTYLLRIISGNGQVNIKLVKE